jgi:ABC-type glycerol-3-phosphate transport system permease component
VGCITGSGYEQHHVSEVEPFEVAAVEGREHVGAGLLRTGGDVRVTRRRAASGRWLRLEATHLALIALVAVMLFPVYVMLKTSFTPFDGILRTPATWLPEPFTLGQNVVFWNLMMAGGVLATVPVALLFSFVQGVFVRGITAGAVKG